MDGLYRLSFKAIWTQFKQEHFSFWMICAYLFFQYFEPQSIYPALDVVPWDKVIVGLTVISVLVDPQKRWVRNPANIWMTLFLGVIIASCFTAVFPTVSWSHWFDFFDWYVIYFLIIITVNTRERYFIFLAIFILASFKMSLFGARTWISRGFGFRDWGIQGPAGFFENSGELSIQMLVFSPIALELALFLKPWLSRVKYCFALVVPLTGAMTVMGASSRGSQFGLAAQIGHFAVSRKLKVRIVLAAVVLVVIGWAMLPDAEKARFTAAGTDKTSVQRLEYWRAGVNMIRNHPLLGIGYFNFPPYFAVSHPDELFEGHAQQPHNIFIQVGTDSGLLGLGIFLMLIYRTLKTTRDIGRACKGNDHAPAFAPCVARGLATSTLGFVVAGQFVTVAYYPFLWINLALAVSLANVVARSAETVPSSVPLQRPGKRSPSFPEKPSTRKRRPRSSAVRPS